MDRGSGPLTGAWGHGVDVEPPSGEQEPVAKHFSPGSFLFTDFRRLIVYWGKIKVIPEG